MLFRRRRFATLNFPTGIRRMKSHGTGKPRHTVSKATRRHLVEALLNWFAKHKRALPWRATRDPYHIWISEVMLQQTQTATVIPFYERFLKQFPNLAALASADDQ